MKSEKENNNVRDKGKKLEELIAMSNKIREKERRNILNFNDFLHESNVNNMLVYRNIFQYFYDMIEYYVPEGIDEYKGDKDSIGFSKYDCTSLFVKNCDEPFFADRLFANRFMKLISGFAKGISHNRIYLFEGPPGSGKTTFLNNLLKKLESYSKLDEGSLYKTYWKIDKEKIGASIISELEDIYISTDKHLEISCPNNDHPILQVPKEYRKQLLDTVISDEDFKNKLFTDKQYEWVLKDVPCHICNSVYNTLLDKLSDPMEVFNMIYAKKVRFNRQFGKGISVNNPGDMLHNRPITNSPLQSSINNIFKTDEIRYIYSEMANTNNGVMALMDIKENNVERLKNLHGIISDGVHKVELVEEYIKTLFLGIVNPEDKRHYEGIQSFKDRIITVNIPYVLDYKTEVNIYLNKFGENIRNKFLPRVLDNFAKIIISSRLNIVSPSIKSWLKDPSIYKKYIDSNMFLLKMSIYTGKIPDYLSEEDLQRFDKETRKALISESELEGKKGISGRQSLNVFGQFITSFEYNNSKMITMDDVKQYFLDEVEINKVVPKDFVDAIVNLYDFNVLQEVKEAVYYYNDEQISKDIQNYLYAINFDYGASVKSIYTNELIEISPEYFNNLESIFVGSNSTEKQRIDFRNETQKTYIRQTIAREIRIENKSIIETNIFKELFEKYTRSLKKNALAPYIENDNFRRAIIDFNDKSFNSYDARIKRDVKRLISNLVNKFNYNIEGACQVCLYVIEKKLSEKYS